MPPILIVILALLLVLAGAGYYFARQILYPKVIPVPETLRRVTEWGWLNGYDYTSWPVEELKISSPHGYTLKALYYSQAGASKTVIISHGFTFSRYESYKFANLFYKRGYNILLYDLRNHGESGGSNTTFGFYEKFDLKALVDCALARLPSGGTVGTVGESLGAATTLLHAAIDDRIAFAIADCPYSDLLALYRYRLRQDYHLPAFPLLPLARQIVHTLSGWWIEQASPIRYIGQVQAPVLFVHGQADTYIPPQMSIDLYNAKTRGIRMLYLAPNAGHAEALPTNLAEYDQQVETFLQAVEEAGKISSPSARTGM